MLSAPARSTFEQYFEIVPALDALTRDAAYRIRHEVYCEDLAFEPIRADGRERDEYDNHALQCLLRHRPSGEFIGVTRLVLPERSTPDSLLPFERTCAGVLYRGTLDPARMPRHRIAEVSRLGVVRGFRRRRGEAFSELPLNEGDNGNTSQPRFPFIPIGLYLGAIALAYRLDINTLFTLTEPRLAQHFSRFGVRVVQIGSEIEHRGLRVPSMIRVNDVISHMGALVLPIWQAVDEEVLAALPKADAAGRKVMESA